METVCPNCYSENAYHDGCCYVCPDCGCEWGNEDNEDDEY